jgi:hypothetical protein
MRQWLEDCGLAVSESRQLPPPDDAGDQLTVSLWLAARPTAGGLATGDSTHNLERTS